MLTVAEIKRFIDEDAASVKKRNAKVGQAYYEGNHDIKDYRLFYWNGDGNLVEDKSRTNTQIPHPFFTELVDQTVQYILSGQDGFIKSDIPELQAELDSYFNENEDFLAELSEVMTGSQTKGWEYMFLYRNDENRLTFQLADSLGVIEVMAKETDANAAAVIYWYIDRIDHGEKKIKRIQVWDDTKVAYYVQTDNGEIEKDTAEKINPRPHTLYQEDGKDEITYEDFGCIPFFRLDNNKKQTSDLKPVKDLIDDYDIMASSLSNNLVDFDHPLHVVKGYPGDDLEKLQQNLKTKRIVGVDAEGGVEVHTVEIPYAAREAKLNLDEKNIYRFGMGLDTRGLKDTSATTNIAIKAAYSLLDLKSSKKTIRLKQFLRKLIRPVLDEINRENGTDYQQTDVYFDFTHEIMSNAEENARIAKTEAETRQIEVNIVLDVAATVGDEQALRAICEIMEWDFDELKGELDKLKEEQNTAHARAILEGVVTDDEQAPETGTDQIPE